MKNSLKKLSSVSVLGLLALSYGASAFGQAAGGTSSRLAGLQGLINRNGGKWVAGETSLSGLPQEELQKLVGLSFTGIKAAPLPESSDKALPAAMDWRNSGGNFVSGIRHQKKCGSCWAFALTAALESYVMRTGNAPGMNLDLSEQVMLSCSGIGSCAGGTLNGNFLQSSGLPPESFYPYTVSEGVCSAAGAGWQNAAYKIDGWGSVRHTIPAMKSALAAYGPFPAGMMVYEDFMNYKSGIYSYTDGKEMGGHAVVIVGYNDAEQYFIAKNSWGTGWGEKGFFRIAYSEVNSTVIFGISAIAYKSGGPKETGPAAANFNSDDAWSRTSPMFESLRQWSR